MAQQCFAMASSSDGGVDPAPEENRLTASEYSPGNRPSSPSKSKIEHRNPSLVLNMNNPLNVDFVHVKSNTSLAETAAANFPMLLLLRCANFAAIKHARQRRKDPMQTPYINHPLGVAMILAEEGGVTDVDVLMAAILHDTVEDTDTTFEEIEEHFGPHVRKIVEEVTDDKTLSWQERKRNQVLNARKASFEAKLVKLADKLYNLRDINRVYPVGWTEIRVQRYFDWAHQVCSGLRGTNPLLERKLEDVFDARKRYTVDNNKCVDIPGHECIQDYDLKLPERVDTDPNLVGSEPETSRTDVNKEAKRETRKREMEQEKERNPSDDGPQ